MKSILALFGFQQNVTRFSANHSYGSKTPLASLPLNFTESGTLLRHMASNPSVGKHSKHIHMPSGCIGIA